LESWRERENLARAMLTGRKHSGGGALPLLRVRAFPLVASGITLVILAGGSAGIAALAALPGLGVPPTVLDPVYAEQCAGCHMAYPPSLAPAVTWDRIMDDMDNHFGQSPGLPPDMVAHLRAWLDANGAGHWDTLPSHVLREPGPGGSQRITDAPGWRRVHRDIPEATFTSPPVYRRSNCDACHSDAASGRFAPQRIAVPETAGQSAK